MHSAKISNCSLGQSPHGGPSAVTIASARDLERIVADSASVGRRCGGGLEIVGIEGMRYPTVIQFLHSSWRQHLKRVSQSVHWTGTWSCCTWPRKCCTSASLADSRFCNVAHCTHGEFARVFSRSISDLDVDSSFERTLHLMHRAVCSFAFHHMASQSLQFKRYMTSIAE